MSFVHFKGQFSMQTACGRSAKMKSQTSERMSDVTCPKCQAAVARRREADKDLGNYTIKDDMIGTARIRREARLPKGVFEHTPEAAIVALCSEPKKWGDVLAAIKDPANAKKFWEFAQASNEELKAWVMGMVKQRQLAIVAGETGTLIVAPGGSSIPGRKKMMGPRENVQHVTYKGRMTKAENVSKMTVGGLKQIVQKILGEASGASKTGKKLPPSSIMKQVTSALASLGFKVTSREKNQGAFKAWLDPVNPEKPEVDTDSMSDEEFEKYISRDDPVKKAPGSPGRVAMKYKKVLSAAGLKTRVTGDRWETLLIGDNFEVHIPNENERQDMGAHIFVKVFAGKHANLEKSGFDTSDLRFGEALIRETTLKTRDGQEWTGDYNRIEKALVVYGSSSGERTAIMNGSFPINTGALQALKSQGAVKRVASPRSPSRVASVGAPLTRGSGAKKAFDKALKKYASNWTDFNDDQPDNDPQGAALDAAEGFFYEFPQWKEWAKALGHSRSIMQEIVADHVYEAMTSSS